MKTKMLWAGAFAAGGLVWLASPELARPARLFTSFLLGPAPVAIMLQARALDEIPRPWPRVQFYFGSMFGLWAIGVVALAVGIASGFTPRIMGFVSLSPAKFALWTAFAMLAAGAVVMAFKAFGFRDHDVMRELIPITAVEKAVFVLLSLSAGVWEEIAFRGFLIPALSAATGSLVAAVALSSLVFGVLHMHQQPGGAARAAVIGIVLAVPFLLTGSLYPSIAAHLLVDVIAGLWLPRWLLR